MSSFMQQSPPDFVAIGHMAVDLLPDEERLGGSAIYAALTVARFGGRAAVLTRANIDQLPDGVRAELEAVSSEVELIIQSSESNTVFENRDVAGRRRQTLHGWAGEIDLSGLPPLWRSSQAIHVAPIAREFDPRQLSKLTPGYLGVTPQGWLRRWGPNLPSPVSHEALRLNNEIMSRIDGLVLAADEYVVARELSEFVGRRGLSVVTRGGQGATAIDRLRRIEVPSYPTRRVDRTGAGDVFAGVLFYLRSQREPVTTSLRLASAAAAISLSGVGISAIPDRDSVEELVAIEASRP